MQLKDIDIITMFDSRDEQAITEMRNNYGIYLRAIVAGVLENDADAEECLNDVYLKLWNSIPPAVPGNLKAYAGEIAKNTALDMWRKHHTQRSNPSDSTVSLDDPDNHEHPVTDPWTDPLGLAKGNAGKRIADGEDPEGKRTEALIARYLRTLKPKKRMIFFARYYYERSVEDIARIMNMPRGTVLSNLGRTREGLRKFLEAEGVEI
ncbi:MAG: RNA polymerase sigma factor [Clostridia bacterium]|nr:RNA polymerase sigma factor [Clostridia bacterium]